MRMRVIAGIFSLSACNACGGSAGIPKMTFSGSSASLPSGTVVEEGALEPILDSEGNATGVEAPNNAIKQVYLADHLRPAEEAFEVAAVDSKTEDFVLAYKDTGDPNLNYKLADVMGDYTQIIDAIFLDTGIALKSGNVDKKNFKIKAEDFSNGERVRVRYRDDTAFKKTLKLAYEPVGPVQFVSTVKRCTDRNTLAVVGQEVTVACTFGEKSTHKILYKTKDPAYQVFSLPNIIDPEMGEWRVYANGVETKDYARNGASVTITVPLADGVTVVLVFMPIQI